MNRLGMIVDLSHVGENTTRAAIRLSRAPVVFTHSSVYSLCNHKRNVPDDIIHSLKENGGIIMVNFFPDFVKCAPNATISDVAEHFHYIKRMVGADYVGIGGDFDGVNRVPRGLEDVSRYPELFAELLRSGQWTVQELKNLAGLNMLRVMRQVEKILEYNYSFNKPTCNCQLVSLLNHLYPTSTKLNTTLYGDPAIFDQYQEIRVNSKNKDSETKIKNLEEITMGKTYSKEEVVIAQNGNGEASASTTQHMPKSTSTELILLITIVVCASVAVVYFVLKKCRTYAVNTLRRELNAANLNDVARIHLNP
ncbi:hypothetical protein HF086_006511 [Spodoptera exigua]|uniref:Dipeptidase n=1 Tax=Spodoptera exigua TaxID=7107 RepID=A0A922MKW0_SPOEX|nr:hypothetical protein HF086_006511 [Spodoptera exigua]